MNILHVMPYSPVPANYGAKLRIYNLMSHLAANHNVSMVYIGSDADAAGIRREFGGQLGKVIACEPQLTRRVRGLGHLKSFLGSHSILYSLGANARLRASVEAEVRTGSYDVVLTEFPHMAFFDIPDGPLRVLDGHNIEYDNFRRMAERSESWLDRMVYRSETEKFHAEEIEAFRRQDLLLFTSERDRRMAAAETPDVPSIVVPNGVDTSFFRPPVSAHEPYSMVFTGILGYVPNSDGITWFLDEIFPRIVAKEPRAKVTIVGATPGRNLLQRASDRVRVTGYVDDVRPYVHEAEVTVVPLRMGGGTRLKILESFAMMSPVVSTPIGAEGIDMVDGEHGLIAGEPQEFADAVLRLFSDHGLSERIARNGARLAGEKYEWSVIGATLEKALQDAVSAQRRKAVQHVS
jgi:glycosyltransferase involved in cell wall biosynthesis